MAGTNGTTKGGFGRVLCLLLAAALVAGAGPVQAGTTQTTTDDGTTDGGTTTHDEACQRWIDQARAEIRTFFEAHVEAWEAFMREVEEEARTFYASSPNATEARQFEADMQARIDARMAEMRDEQEAFHARMRTGFEEHCGSASTYEDYAVHYGYGADADGSSSGTVPGDGWTYSAECRAYDEERHRRAEEVRARYETEFRALEEDWHAFAAEGNHTEEEWSAFKANMTERERDLRARLEADLEALFADVPDRPECIPPDRREPTAAAPLGECGFEYVQKATTAFQAEVREDAEAFARTQDEKRRAFHARVEAAWEAFTADQRARTEAFAAEGNHTEDDRAAFEAELRADHDAFTAQVQNETEAFEAQLRREWDAFTARLDRKQQAFVDELRAECAGNASSAGDHAAVEAARQRCQTRLRVEHEAFRQEGNHTADEVEAFQRQLMVEMESCMREAHAQWRARVGAAVEASGPRDRIGSWRMEWDPQTNTGELTGRYVSLGGDANTNTMFDISVQGVVYLDQIAPTSRFEDDGFRMGDGDRGSWLTARGEGVRLRIVDTPAGVINLAATDGHAILLTVPDHFDVVRADAGWRLVPSGDGDDGGGDDGGSDGTASALVRVSPDASSWNPSSRILRVEGDAVFLVPDRGDNAVLPDAANRHRDPIMDAVEDRRLGAEVTVAADAAADDGAAEDVLLYEDVGVSVANRADEGAVEVTLSAELDDGKTFVINVDQALIGDGGRVEVTYFTVDEATGERIEETIAQADGIEDVLDPTDDAGPEYLVALGADGAQLLVSVPDWSTHVVRVQGMPAAEPLPAPGALAAMAVLVAAAVAVAAVRRRRGEDGRGGSGT